MIFPCVHSKSLLKFCAFMHPVLAGYAFLGEEFIDFLNLDIYHHKILNVLRASLAVFIIVTSGILYLLQLAVQERVLHLNKIRIYSVTFFILFLITNSLYSIKVSKNNQTKWIHVSFDATLYFHYYNFTLQFIAIVQFLNEQKDMNNPPSQVLRNGVRIFLVLFCIYQWVRLTNSISTGVHTDIFTTSKAEGKYLPGSINYIFILTVILQVCHVSWTMITVLILIGMYKKNKSYIKLYFYLKFIIYGFGGVLIRSRVWLRRMYVEIPVKSGLNLTFRVQYICEIWLVLLYINYLEWEKLQEKIKIECGDASSENVLEFNFSDNHMKKMIKKFTVSPWRLKLGDLLGEGNFGEVYKGSLRNLTLHDFLKSTPTAVKILKRDQVDKNALVSEIKSLLLVQMHSNLVKILGLTWKESRLCILMEYCTLGNLKSYLHEMRTTVNFSNSIHFQNFSENITPNELKQFSQWALEIASAMEFIGRKKIVHADLATRNVLLDENKVAKLTDFGLSIRLYNYQLYAKSHAQFLPWRWMAPEALSDLKFSSKSDVWAYGITLWEMYTFGNCPWQNFEWSSDFVGQLQNGLQLEKPDLISEDLYSNVMKHCWLVDEKKRITFPDIVEYLKEIKQQE